MKKKKEDKEELSTSQACVRLWAFSRKEESDRGQVGEREATESDRILAHNNSSRQRKIAAAERQKEGQSVVAEAK